MMALQTARALLKVSNRALKGERLTGFNAFLNDSETHKTAKCAAKTADCFLNIDLLEEAMTVRASNQILELVQRFNAASEDH